MERKIGEIFTYNGKTYQVVKDNTCEGCAFMKNGHCFSISKLLGLCSYTNRTDKTGVIFKEINNMETKNKQITIDIPEGIEKKKKNSDLAKGIVKFKKKDITYDDILQECPTNFSGLRVRNHCLDKILAISQLMNIAKYYNGDWEPNWSDPSMYKYFIICAGDIYKIDYNCKSIYNNIYFKNKKDAQAVINNPNFRNILDAIYKNSLCKH